MTGQLVSYTSPAKQLMVEQYFASKRTLPSTAYWFGVVADPSSSGFLFMDNTTVAPNTSTVPFAHWGWNYNTKLAQGGYRCVVARGSQKYDFFIGESSQISLRQYYSTTTDDKYGWDLELCSGTVYAYICEVPATWYPCYPPPSPSPPPPSPPDAPLPPAPPASEWCWNALRVVHIAASLERGMASPLWILEVGP